MHRSLSKILFTAGRFLLCLLALAAGMTAQPLALEEGRQQDRAQVPEASSKRDVVVQRADADFLFALVDGNHDNRIDGQEFDAFCEMEWRELDPRDTGSVKPEAISADPHAVAIFGDSIPASGAVLSREAFAGRCHQRFERADANHDGSLDTGEFASLLGVLPPPRTISQPSALRLSSLAGPFAPGLPSCAELGHGAARGLAGTEGVSSLTAEIVPADGIDAAYCRVQFIYNSGLSGPKDGYDEGQSQAIAIRIGLPLRPDDGGTIAWNGRIQNIGSGGCMGHLPGVTIATNAGFASASTDGGHGAPWISFNCGFGVIQSKHELNRGLIRDFSAEHVRWQATWSKRLVQMYYGQPAQRTYWCGCSQGGREGLIALQTLPAEYDGILAGGSAVYWMRFQMAQAWSGLVIKDMLRSKGKDLTPAQINQTVRSPDPGEIKLSRV